VSKGKVDYTNQVAGFFRAPNTFAYYDALPYAHGAQQLLTWALEKLDSAGFDFSSLSLNSENNSIMAINLMYTGEPPTWAQGMWFHKGYLNTFTSSSGIKAGDYNCSPAKAPLGIGVVAHENGHMIGKWPDTYKYNQNTGPDGIGAFDLMCWYGSSQNPVPPNPLFRLNAGWGKNFDISNLSGQVTDTANLGNIRSFRNDNDTNEFYLLEAREEEGRSFYIPDRGLTIWRINRLGDNQTLNHEVTLIPAGNDVNNMTNACFRAGFKPTFNQSTSPSSRWRNGDPSGLKLSNISTPGSTMTYNAGQGTNAAILKLLYKGISYDDNGNGQIEPGETIRFEMKVLNTGGNPSGAVSVSCTGIAPFTNYYTISNPAQNFPILNSGQEFTMEFQIQVISSAVAGNQITLRFQVQENGNTLYVTRKFLVGSFLNMVSGIDSLCNYLYFDPGGLNPYTNNTFITQTLYPKNPASALKAEFLSFDLESEANCQYDFLQVFNGPTPSFPQFGKFCGTNSPGTIVSTHPGGALTFRFKADEGVTGDGWLARITCVPFTETSGRDPAADWQPYPNPAGEEIFLPAFSVPVDVQLLDMRGRVCLRLKTEVGQLGKLPVTGLEGGLYLLKASAASMQKIMKWSVFHR
jgi:M6 family metalloprotease-like protein